MKSFKKISILESLVPSFFHQRSPSFLFHPIFFHFLQGPKEHLFYLIRYKIHVHLQD